MVERSVVMKVVWKVAWTASLLVVKLVGPVAESSVDLTGLEMADPMVVLWGDEKVAL